MKWGISRVSLFVGLGISVIGLFVVAAPPVKVHAAINSQINFQGKLTNPDGTNVSNGTYSIRFRIYNDATLDAASVCNPGTNTCKWEETQATVSVADGIFRVALGSSTSLPGSVDFNTNGLYLGIKVGSDSEMTPRVQFTASPYAFNSDKLNGIASTGYVQLGQSASAQTDSSTNSSIFINKTAAGNLLRLQASASDILTLSSAGAFTLNGSLTSSGGAISLTGNAASSLTTSSGALTITSAAASTWSTTAGNLTIQAGSGTVSLGSSTNLIAAGALSISSGSATALSLDSGTTGALNIGTSANAKTITLGNTTGATKIAAVVGADTAAFSVQGASANQYFNVDTSAADIVTVGNSTNGTSFKAYLSAGNQVSVVANAVPTVDQVSITNAGQGVTAAGVNGLAINFVGGAAAVEASGARVDLTPGTTTGGTWNGLRIVANATGAASGVSEYGINLDGPTSPGAGSEVGITIDANWDAGLQMGAKTSEPGTPPTDNIYVYARKVAGRSILRQKSPSGVSFAYQPALFEQAISYIGPGSGTATTSFGNTWTVDTTLSHPTAGQIFGYTMNFATAATSSDTAGVSQASAQWMRGSAVGANGFFFVARVGTPDANYGSGSTGARLWVGLTSNAAATMSNSDNPAGSFAGFQYSTVRGDTAWNLITKDGSTLSTPVSTLAIAQNKLYDMYLYMPPYTVSGTPTLYWRIDNLTDGTTQEGSTTTNLPAAGTLMRAEAALRTLTTTARNLRVAKIYIEADR